ncbi:exodeoxyribonuclease VII large subunit [Spongiibacter sp. KMU-158]|uniref:Exodeoxyribonuclease 7 large subunit n=1 Tax=Spongiibacter pelagi TaxID=2760804 RepID=A0A927C2X5_9GAMM|nr:exodeoxyribonuclease VII large subunit [Spongiibacter pelagi]MBD2860323.1 exodeoxyribonuclease VII large subunit [Spongiibacter pelagi]
MLEATTQNQTLSVSQLNRMARGLLEDCFTNIAVTGEISTLSRPSSGHWYFTLKDAQAQIRCAFFRNKNMRCRIQPEQGQQVVVRGQVSLYEGRGDYQLIVDQLEPAGSGALAAAFEKLKQELQAAGWFEQQYKKPLPETIKHIAVVTSPTGAALQDIQAVLKRRWPAMRISVLPVLVQGEQAAGQIVNAIEQANHWASTQQQDFDVVLLSRGGGSLEDLWPFNEKPVAEAIFRSQLPIVSAVGHEVDFTISDFVADVRAPTPSAAAELLSPDQAELISRLQLASGRLKQASQRQLLLARQKVLQLQQRLRDPRRQLQQQSQRLDELELRLRASVKSQQRQRLQRYQHLATRLALQSPQRQLDEKRKALRLLEERLKKSWPTKYTEQQQRLTYLLKQLQALGPQQTLSRGYSILQNEQGQVISSAQQLEKGQRLKATLAKGETTVRVDN